ncbi:MAG TPA: hypothetical protein VF169_10880 [Albitalea sp.]|uniref:hypothetical protein n=1 Tax=Piscinibacter sp. TaxID=1903157 RepID=UPI002ED299C5
MSNKVDSSEAERERPQGLRADDAAILAALASQWLMLMPRPAQARGGSDIQTAGVRGAGGARMLEEVASSIAEFTNPPTGTCEFSIELPAAGVIDGHVTVKAGGAVNLALRPRSRFTAEFLAARRERLQRRATLDTGVEIVLDIRQP